MTKNKKILYLVLTAGVIGTYLLVVFFAFFAPQPEQDARPDPITPSPTRATTRTQSPLDKVVERVEQGTPLTTNGLGVRSQLIERADSYGYIEKQNEFTLIYLKDLNVFQIRLTTTDISKGEAAAFSYLMSEGLSINAICKLPVLLYINPRVLKEDTDFNPIPEECQNI